MDRVFWRRFDIEQKQFAMTLSLLQCFTKTQAAVLLGSTDVPGRLWGFVSYSTLISEEGNMYVMHNLLKDYLDEKFSLSDEEFHRLAWSKAAAALTFARRNLEAVRYLIRAGEFSAAFEVSLSPAEMTEFVNRYSQDVEQLLLGVNGQVLLRRLDTCLDLGIWGILSQNGYFAEIVSKRLKGLQKPADLDAEAESNIIAVVELIASFCSYGNAAEMAAHFQAAWKAAGRQIYRAASSWTSGVSSGVQMFWQSSGALEETYEVVAQNLDTYCKLTGNHGAGGDNAMLAEMTLLRGRETEAEIQAYKAIYRASRYKQDSIVFCAAVILCRLAILQGDIKKFQRNMDLIDRHSFQGTEPGCAVSGDICRGILFSLLGLEKQIPEWLLDLSEIRRHVYSYAVPYAQKIFLFFLRRREKAKFLALTEEFIKEAEALHQLMAVIYCLLEQSVWYEENHMRSEALDSLERALGYALPDKVYLPFAEYYEALCHVLEDSALACTDKAGLNCIRKLGKKASKGISIIRAAFSPSTLPLTIREREIALLAQKRLSTKEIAVSLNISYATVKNTLSKVYNKLGIKGKTEIYDLQI